MHPGLLPMMSGGGGSSLLLLPDETPPIASRVGGDLSKILTGPCSLRVDGNLVGHTIDGITVAGQPNIRVRQVDEYGTHKADLLYDGEAVDFTTTMAQWTATVLRLVYAWGSQGASYVGIGATPGGTAQSRAKPLVIHPLASGGSTVNDVTFFRVVVDQPQEIKFGTVTGDRVCGVKLTALVDETRNDGQLLGRIGHPEA